jgi:hypothetical protein
MNIFITHDDPVECASALADQHLQSQVEEAAKILTAALYRHEITDRVLGQPRNTNGRYAQWAAENWNQFMWLAIHGMALVDEHHFRFGGVHKNAKDILIAGNIGSLMLDEDPHTPSKWPRSKASEAFTDRDVFRAYRQVLREKYAVWAQTGRAACWTGTEPPTWLQPR